MLAEYGIAIESRLDYDARFSWGKSKNVHAAVNSMNLSLQAPDARSVAAILAVFVTVALGSSSARAKSEDVRDDSDRWVPSLSVNLEMTIQSAKGTVASEFVPSGAPFRPSADNDGTMLSPNVGGSLEIMTPVVAPVRFAPRFFFDGEIYSVSNQRRTIATEGDPTGLVEPSNPIFSVDAIAGQGSRTQVDLDNVSYGAGVGIAIPVVLGDYRVWFKPSARYLRRKYTFSGTVDEAFRPDINGPSTLVEMAGNADLEVDAVGPGFEVNVEAFEKGRVGASVFVNVGAYKVLGDRSVEFGDTVTYANPFAPGTQTVTASWSGEVDAWIYRAGVGLRLRWMGLPTGWLGMGRSDSRAN
jgi:hypothetical protein